MSARLPYIDATRKPAPLTSDQQAESAAVLIALVRREITLPEAIRRLPGQTRMETNP
jgi:hypothetical protein